MNNTWKTTFLLEQNQRKHRLNVRKTFKFSTAFLPNLRNRKIPADEIKSFVYLKENNIPERMEDMQVMYGHGRQLMQIVS